MRVTVDVGLRASPQQREALHETMQEINALCTRISKVAWLREVFDTVGLRDRSDEFDDGHIPASILDVCIENVATVYHRRSKVRNHLMFDVMSPVPSCAVKFDFGENRVAFWTTAGEMYFPFVAQHADWLMGFSGEANLARYADSFWVLAVCHADIPGMAGDDRMYEHFCDLAVDGGLSVREQRMSNGSDDRVAHVLAQEILKTSAIGGEVIMRPMVGVRLLLPEYADAMAVAEAIDAEQTTTGFLDFTGQACVAIPANKSGILPVVVAVAKVIHGMLEIHTETINQWSLPCSCLLYVEDMTVEELAHQAAEAEQVLEILDAAQSLVTGLDRMGQCQDDELRSLLVNALQRVSDSSQNYLALAHEWRNGMAQ
jgi:hypothetical protein